jgi:phosphatidate cytidylyltransferase
VNLPGGVGFVLFLTFLVAVHDVAAFVVGRLLGRHPLRPRLSPGKTWEGAQATARL